MRKQSVSENEHISKNLVGEIKLPLTQKLIRGFSAVFVPLAANIRRSYVFGVNSAGSRICAAESKMRGILWHQQTLFYK